METSTQMQIGERLGPYEIRDTLGQGGMAQVFKAWHTGLHRFEALKVPIPRAHAASQGKRLFISRFLTEARTAASLRHPHIATIYSVSEADAAQPFFAMELVEGSDLADLIHKRTRLTLDETLSILEPVAAGAGLCTWSGHCSSRHQAWQCAARSQRRTLESQSRRFRHRPRGARGR